MKRELLCKYTKGTLLVMLTTVVGSFCLLLIICTLSAPYFSHACERSPNPTEGILDWVCVVLVLGFVQGWGLTRNVSVVAVPLGWFIVYALLALLFAIYSFQSRQDMMEGLGLLFILPVLAALSARRGHWYRAERKWAHLVWLVAMLVLFILVLTVGASKFQVLVRRIA